MWAVGEASLQSQIGNKIPLELNNDRRQCASYPSLRSARRLLGYPHHGGRSVSRAAKLVDHLIDTRLMFLRLPLLVGFAISSPPFRGSKPRTASATAVNILGNDNRLHV